MKYANGTQFTRTLKSSKFQYFEEDCFCESCLYRCDGGKSRKASCALDMCCCTDIRAEAVKAGRIKRTRGWAKQCTE
jgi:hypothetical protein